MSFFSFEKSLILLIPTWVSFNRNAQVSFVEKPQLKIISLQNNKHVLNQKKLLQVPL